MPWGVSNADRSSEQIATKNKRFECKKWKICSTVGMAEANRCEKQAIPFKVGAMACSIETHRSKSLRKTSDLITKTRKFAVQQCKSLWKTSDSIGNASPTSNWNRSHMHIAVKNKRFHWKSWNQQRSDWLSYAESLRKTSDSLNCWGITTAIILGIQESHMKNKRFGVKRSRK